MFLSRTLIIVIFVTFIYSDSLEKVGIVVCKGPFPLRAKKRAFFVSFIDVFALKIEASAKQRKKINKTNKE